MIPTMWPSGKGKTKKTVNQSLVAREQGIKRQNTGEFLKQGEFSVQYSDDIYMSVYIFQAQRIYTTQSDSVINDDLWVIMMFTDYNKYTIWWGYR